MKILDYKRNLLCNHYKNYFSAFTILGNHTFAAIRGKESYELLSTALSDLIRDINGVIKKGQIKVGDTTYQLNFLLGGDYKV